MSRVRPTKYHKHLSRLAQSALVLFAYTPITADTLPMTADTLPMTADTFTGLTGRR